MKEITMEIKQERGPLYMAQGTVNGRKRLYTLQLERVQKAENRIKVAAAAGVLAGIAAGAAVVIAVMNFLG